VKVGPSLAKIPLDLLVFLVAFWRLCATRYQSIHTHEEAGIIGVVLGLIFGCKHLYYMHSDLAQQVVSSEFTTNPLLIGLVEMVQKLIVRHADAIIAICPDIEISAKRMTRRTPIYMIENSAVDEELAAATPDEVARLKRQLRLNDGPVLLYTGTLESYQGIDLLLQSIPAVHAQFPKAQYVLVGGKAEQVNRWQTLARQLQIADVVRFVGQRPLAEMPGYMALADILLSPRSKGTNTPLKLYTYLHAGKPILATNIYSQTQVLSPQTAMLVEPTEDGLAQGAIALLRDPQRAKAIGENGRLFAEEHYSWHVFLKKSMEVQREFHTNLLASVA
jgi:glycosyltransferase involved in cell wall biosynthesis